MNLFSNVVIFEDVCSDSNKVNFERTSVWDDADLCAWLVPQRDWSLGKASGFAEDIINVWVV